MAWKKNNFPQKTDTEREKEYEMAKNEDGNRIEEEIMERKGKYNQGRKRKGREIKREEQTSSR